VAAMRFLQGHPLAGAVLVPDFLFLTIKKKFELKNKI
jgi:hypothetical protein